MSMKNQMDYYSPPTDSAQLCKLPIVRFMHFIEEHYKLKFGKYFYYLYNILLFID